MKKAACVLLAIMITVGILSIVPINALGITASESKTKLDSLISEYPEGTKNPKKECYDFIALLTNRLFGHGLPTQASNKYAFTSESYSKNFIQIGKTLTVNGGTLTENSLRDLFVSAKPGDVVQMNYTTKKGQDSYHTMMVYSASNTGVVLYHAGRYKDRDGDGISEYGNIYLGASIGNDKLNGTSKNEMTYSQFKDYLKNSGDGISLYRSKKLEEKSSSTQTQNIVSYKFNTVDGNIASTYNNSVDMTVSVFGVNCLNVLKTIDRIIESRINVQNNIKVLFIDIDKREKSVVKQFADEYKGSNITFCYDESNGASNAVWNFAKIAELEDGIATPLIVFTKRDGSIFKITEGLLEADYLRELANCDTSKEQQIEVRVSGKENYDYSYAVLNNLNNLRRKLNLPTLKMDKTLLVAAMNRAAELSVYYSHTRPNGKSCFTILESRSGSFAENIAIGQKTPDDVMYSWSSSVGHYNNMTNKAFASVGIGCFTTSDGYLCWVQMFSSNQASSTTKSGTQVKEHIFNAQLRNLSLHASSEKDIHKLKKGDYTKINIWNLNKGFPYSKQMINGFLFKYTSTNNNVITVADNGYCTIKGNGETTISMAHKGTDSFRMMMDLCVGHIYENTCDNICSYCGAKRTVKHTYTNSYDSVCNVCGYARAVILNQPKNALALNGKMATVTVNAAGLGLKYKWYYKEKDGKSFALTNSFKSNTYSIQMNSTRAGRQIYCVITDKHGNTVKTNTVTLNMKTVSKIIQQPVSAWVQYNKTAKVTVGAVGDGLTYKWYYKEKDGKSFALTNSFKGNTYSVSMNAARSGRQLYCVVTDKYGNKVKTNTVTINMINVAAIKYSPANASAKVGSNVKFTVVALGDKLKYQWQVKTPTGTWKNTTTTGYNTKAITVNATKARAGYKYRCIVTDGYGNKKTSNAATLYLK